MSSMKKHTLPQDVKAEFEGQPKLLDSWLMVGYRQWYKKKYETVKHSSKERHLDRQISALDGSKYIELKNKVRKLIGKK